ncbi:hypothetical protein CIK05_09455 [Bdellovibrio sp. qaytius]|nr:hypothetical protein CIK05_09455 [Bdellovibrio sp. qaytius]
MGRYLVVDIEDKSVEQIIEALRAVDAQAQIEKFSTLEEFEAHANAITPENIASFWNFDLMVLDYGQHTPQAWPEKIAKFKSQNLKEFSIVLTSYENNFTLAKFIRPLDIYNFVFKPFDSLILKESLNLALKIKKKAAPLEMKSQSATAFIALLKEVELQTVSELGFVTLSDSQIDAGSISKYFSAMFLNGKKQSVWAQCLVSIPHPQKAGYFINKFQFFGVDQPLLTTVRKYIAAHKKDTASSALWNLNPPKTTIPLKLAIIGLDNDENKSLAQEIQSRYNNVTPEIVKLDPSKKSADQAMFDHHFCLNTTDIKHENFKEMFKPECIHLWYAPNIPKEDDLKVHATEYRDLFVRPLDRSYFYKKLKIHLNALSEKEPSHLSNITSHEVMKVANKVKISEISELYVNLVYSRELHFKEFREFVFLSDDESQTVELPAFCHYTEKSASTGKDDPPGFLHQFVFYGMTDHFLKQIRLWLLHNYIISNQKD